MPKFLTYEDLAKFDPSEAANFRSIFGDGIAVNPVLFALYWDRLDWANIAANLLDKQRFAQYHDALIKLCEKFDELALNLRVSLEFYSLDLKHPLMKLTDRRPLPHAKVMHLNNTYTDTVREIRKARASVFANLYLQM